MTIYVLGLTLIVILVVFYFYIKKTNRKDQVIAEKNRLISEQNALLTNFKIRFNEVFNAEAELLALKNISQQELAQLDEAKHLARQEQQVLTDKANQLLMAYKATKVMHDGLVRQIAVFNDEIELIELGFYEPKFNFDSSDEFKADIDNCRTRQKALLKNKTSTGAIYCPREWSVDGSRTEGRKMTEKGIRLTARAFNNECEAAIAGCTWKNATKIEERIKKAFADINKLNESNHIFITQHFLKEKLTELDLYYGYHKKKQREKEEQTEIRAQMREDAKVEAEIKKMEQEAIRDEERYQKALAAAKNELQDASDNMKIKLQNKIAELESALTEAKQKHLRAQSMAEITKQGHVYIISNIGSFGKNVYKIGMTRRLEPLDRVSELGDASVPFEFDIHAMIHSIDAPALEKKLHDKFDTKRINMVNRRKEFFSATLSEIKAEVFNIAGKDAQFIETAVARDYYETKLLQQKREIEKGQKALSSNEQLEASLLDELAEIIST